MAQIRSTSWPMLLAMAGVAIEFCVSANLLTSIGLPYVTDGGLPPEKIHPGTYLICAAFMARVASHERQNATTWYLLGDEKELGLYLGCLGYCLVYMLATTGTGNIIVLLDTFLPAGLLACVLKDASAKELLTLRRVFQFGICVNGLIALGEAALNARLIPLYLNGSESHSADAEFRPTALYDHPLTGGVMTLMALAFPPRSHWWKVFYLAVAIAALIAFGGRVSIVAALTNSVMTLAATFVRCMLRRERAALHLALSYGGLTIACAAMALTVFEAGFGERLLSHLYWDPSAQVRLAQWSLLGELSSWQIIFGTKREDLLLLLTPLWLTSGVDVIENFWLLMFANLGLVGFPVFVFGLGALLLWCWQRTGLRGRMLLVSVMVVVSTSNSLGRKSTLLVGLVAAIACLPEWRSDGNGQTGVLSKPLSGGSLVFSQT
jgi:hypothetical protein